MSSEIREVNVSHIDGKTMQPQILKGRCQMVEDYSGAMNFVVQFQNEDIIAVEVDDIKDLLDIKNKSYDKFKNADELYEAYLNLEKNYTKKSQQLSKLANDLEPRFKRGEMPYTIQFYGSRIEAVCLGKIKNVMYYPALGSNELIKYYEFEDSAIKTRNERELFKTKEEAIERLKEVEGKIWRV